MPRKEIFIEIEAHAFLRMLDRASQYGFNYYECKERAFETVRLGKLAQIKHLSRHYETYYKYFRDNISFYVVCQTREFEGFTKILIKTVIIEKGRE